MSLRQFKVSSQGFVDTGKYSQMLRIGYLTKWIGEWPQSASSLNARGPNPVQSPLGKD